MAILESDAKAVCFLIGVVLISEKETIIIRPKCSRQLSVNKDFLKKWDCCGSAKIKF